MKSSSVHPPNRTTDGPQAKKNWVSTCTGMEFVWIQSLGTLVGKCEVTNGEFRKMNPSHDSGRHRELSLNADRQPVVCVNFDDARAYATWLTQQDKAGLGTWYYRLPSEDEWLAFAQCGDDREYPWGNEWPPQSGKAGNYHGQEGAAGSSKISGYDDGHPVTAPVDELWMNPWGLYGVGGNVWEACALDQTGETFGSWRGASWDHSCPDYLRCTAQGVSNGVRRYNRGGFRLVLASKP